MKSLCLCGTGHIIAASVSGANRTCWSYTLPNRSSIDRTALRGPGLFSRYTIDPLPRIAPWAWDAAYCQTLDANTDVRMIHRIGAARSAHGLVTPAPPILDRLATILMAWLGAHRWWNTAFRREDPDWCVQIERYMEDAARLNLSSEDFSR